MLLGPAAARMRQEGGSVTRNVNVAGCRTQCSCESPGAIAGRCESPAVKVSRLHRMKERLHVRVVVHLAGAVHTLSDTEPRELAAVFEGSVLDAAVAMKHERRSR